MSQQTFIDSLKSSARGLWQGRFTPLDFADAFYSAIRRGFEQAWQEGAAECGVLPDERTKEEQDKLNLIIGDNFQYVGQLADWIYQNRKGVGSWDSIISRLGLWANRYQEVKAQAQSMACADQKLKWVIGNTERHCRTCLKLNGRVHRASLWNSKNVYPRMIGDRLACHGYNCDCSFLPTTEPATKGRFPSLP